LAQLYEQIKNNALDSGCEGQDAKTLAKDERLEDFRKAALVVVEH
jgi:hypothetical protein